MVEQKICNTWTIVRFSALKHVLSVARMPLGKSYLITLFWKPMPLGFKRRPLESRLGIKIIST